MSLARDIFVGFLGAGAVGAVVLGRVVQVPWAKGTTRTVYVLKVGNVELCPELWVRFLVARYYARKAGFDLVPTSSFRSPEKQAELRARAEAGEPGIYMPANFSDHQLGRAIDIGSGPGRDWLHANKERFGLRDIMPGDPPHFMLAP